MVLPLHPRTRQALERFGLLACLERIESLHLSEPLGYLEFVSLVSSAARGDYRFRRHSGRDDVSARPCVTMRENTERPITVDVGSNVLAGTQPTSVKCHIDSVLAADAVEAVVFRIFGMVERRCGSLRDLREELAA